ncbi:hypothetical protein [Halostagnicola sp. A-GB9-2]|uniref:DUF7344 domain-containing protein n=1 Tax=Halostagnicola sp. A-GB9-2 TaxID=3048066 RepID=UPI0024C0BA1B|nr:hypothetical protein [Halostagnicola sp. A-GB9-2]MDJ1431158.1 hypothetical protein [Halostagnicola sp. A-GB9-2]
MQLLNTLRNGINTKSNRPTKTISPSDAYSLLQNERRRLIIEFLATMGGTETDAATIADHLAELGDDRNSSYISCIQQHLPRMAKSGVIEFTESKEVTVCPELQAVWEAHQVVEKSLE